MCIRDRTGGGIILSENNRELLMAMNDKCNRLADKEIGLENHVLHLPGPDWFWTA